MLHGAREAVKKKAVDGVRLLEAGLDHARGHVGGHEAASVDVFLGFDAKRGALADVGAEQVTSGDVGHAELVGEDGSLGTFAGAGRAEENETH